MKTEAFFKELDKHSNIKVYKNIDSSLVNKFIEKYEKFKDKFFYEQFINSGGFVIDNWIRIYGCGELNVIEKNDLYNKDNIMDILIGEDILGGLFALKNGYIHYYAPDTNKWESFDVYYTQFLDWLINREEDVDNFYKYYRWENWKEECQKLKLSQGIHFFPLLQTDYDINKRSRKAISIDELIRFNLGK